VRIRIVAGCERGVRVGDPDHQVAAAGLPGQKVPEVVIVQNLKATVYDANVDYLPHRSSM
jgi:hypothetical protein